MPRLGNRRTRSRDGLDEILGPAGFAPVVMESVTLDLGGPFDQVWAGISSLHDFEPLDEAAMARLRDVFLDVFRESLTPEGTVPFSYKVLIATAQRL